MRSPAGKKADQKTKKTKKNSNLGEIRRRRFERANNKIVQNEPSKLLKTKDRPRVRFGGTQGTKCGCNPWIARTNIRMAFPEWPSTRGQIGVMTPAQTFDWKHIARKLQSIRGFLADGSARPALTRINELVSELRCEGEDTPSKEPWRIVAAHLRSAVVHVEMGRLATAIDAVDKALYIATHEPQAAIDAPDAQLNV
jgi:hypothetical protein